MQLSYGRAFAEANRQLSNARFYERLDLYPIEVYQHLVETTLNAMIDANQLPPSAKSLNVSTPKTSRFYLLSKILISKGLDIHRQVKINDKTEQRSESS